MIFSRSRNLELLSTLKIANLPNERLTESKFLGVIVDENLTWSRHIKTIQTKMARYIGLMYKLKSQLPLKVRIQIFHSFVQSHINYCSLVSGALAQKLILIHYSGHRKMVCEQLYQVSLTIDIDLMVHYLVIQNRISPNMIFSQYKM